MRPTVATYMVSLDALKSLAREVIMVVAATKSMLFESIQVGLLMNPRANITLSRKRPVNKLFWILLTTIFSVQAGCY